MTTIDSQIESKSCSVKFYMGIFFLKSSPKEWFKEAAVKAGKLSHDWICVILHSTVKCLPHDKPITLRLRVTVCYCACAVCACGLQSTVEGVHDFGVNFFIAEVTSNRILEWISILRRKGQGSSKSFTEINILFVR